MGVGTFGAVSLVFSLVAETEKFLAREATVSKIPAVEVTVEKRFGSGCKRLHGEGGSWVRLPSALPVVGGGG